VSAQDREKQQAAARAVGLVREGMVVGLGTGTTAEMFVRLLADRVGPGLRITGVPTSVRTRSLAESLGIPLCPADSVPAIDLTIDGADEIDGALRLIKGAGGALLYEKIVAEASQAMVVIADASKRVDTLGAAALPVEVVPFGWERNAALIAEAAGRVAPGPGVVRRRGEPGEPYRTDAGHFILDCRLGAIHDPVGLAGFLDGRAGIVEHGLFLGRATAALIGVGDAVEVIGTLP
jgi:ribose 5-phosphate isomerase A